MVPKSAVFANSIIKELKRQPRTALELCDAVAFAQRRRWACYVQKRGEAGAKQQVHTDLQTLKRLGVIERVRLMGRYDLWRLAEACKDSAPRTLVQEFAKLPRKAQAEFVKMAHERRTGLLIVQQRGKLIGVPKHNVLAAMQALDIKVKAELVLLA